MLEELLIQIRSVYDSSGMTEARENVASAQTATEDMAAASVMGNEETQAAVEATGQTYMDAKGKIVDFGAASDQAAATMSYNMGAASDRVTEFNNDIEEGTNAVQQGLSPALQGIDTSHLEQMGTDMTENVATTDEASDSVEKLSGKFSALQSVGGMALMMLGTLMLGLADKAISAAETVQGSMSKMGGALGMSATQAIASTPQLEKMAQGWSNQTGIDPETLASSVSALSVYPGMAGNTQAINSTMPVIGGLSTALGTDPTAAAQAYGKVLTSATPSTMMTAKLGITTNSLNQGSIATGGSSTFAADDPTQRIAALNNALMQNGNIAKINAAYANSSAGKMAIFNGKLTEMEATIGADLVPTLTWLMNNVLSPLGSAMSKYPALGSIVALFLVLGGALGLLAGPLMALGQLGPAITEIKAVGSAIWNLPSTISGGINALKERFASVGDSADEAAGKEDILTTSQELSGNASEESAAKVDTYLGATIASGTAAEENAVKIDAFTASEDLAGTGGTVGGAEKGAGFMEEEAGSIGSMSGVAESIAGGFVVAAGAVMSFVGALASATMATLIFLATNPIGWAILIGIAIVAVISYFHLWGPIINDTKALFNGLGKDAVHALQMIWVGLQQFGADLGNIVPSVENFKNIVVNDAENLVNGFMNYIKSLPGLVYNEFLSIGSYMMQAGSQLYNDAVHIGQNIVNGLKKAAGINSPGYMYYAIKGELDLIHETMNSSSGILGEDGKKIGSSIVGGLTEGTSKSAIKSVATNAISPTTPQSTSEKPQTVVNMYFTQKQNKEDSKQIVDAVTKEVKKLNDINGR
jgi:hypothetical protein